MTTIAYRDGVMAADTGSNFDGLKSEARKIFRVGDALLGGAGNFVDFIVFKQWWQTGSDLKDLPEFRQYGSNDGPNFTALVASPAGLTWWSQHFQPEDLMVEFWAIGSGAMAALAAMHMGTDAAKAIEIAIKTDYNSNGTVHAERVED